MRRAARTDANQAAIVSAMRSAGASVWVCAGGCGKTEHRAPSQMTKRMCAPCRFASYRGDGNPNFRNAAEKRCLMCGGHFSSYSKTGVYCSQRCYVLTKRAAPTKCPKPPKAVMPTRCPRPPKPSARVEGTCAQCGVVYSQFLSEQRRGRLYCRYQCHLDSGGARRAGLASAQITMNKYGAKKDANHAPIVDALKAHGVSVIDTTHMGGGFPDLVLGWANVTLLMEIKNPKTSYGRKGLNKNQIRWKEEWVGGPYAVVSSVGGAIAAVNALAPIATVTDVDGALRVVAAMKQGAT